MITDKINRGKLFSDFENTNAELLTIISAVNEKQLNKIPFENSWTAAQVADHVTRSINGMGEALKMPGKFTDRQPDEKANDLKTMFLNFETKMKSPVFISPEHDVYEKKMLIDKLKKAGIELIKTGKNVNLSELLDLSPLGELTRLEVIHFLLYHTQRHIHQIKNILETVNN